MPALEPGSDADARSDAEVIAAIREGDSSAIDELYRRHHRAAMSFAESLAGRTLAPDLVSDAFLRIIDLLRRGGGPTQVFRSYLYTTVRNLYIDHVRHHSRQTSLPDFGPLEAEFALGDGLDDHFEHSLVKKAFASLPERWQTALWYTTVEGVSLDDAGRFLGVAPNAVAALTFRAREGLRQAYLAEHLNLTEEQSCSEVWEALPKFVRGGLRARMRETVEEHLQGCRRCSTAVLELDEVNSNLRGVLVVALLGAATAGYLDRALGPAPTPAPVAPSGVSGFGKIAAVVGAAAAAGVLVLAWPHHGASRSESEGPSRGPATARPLPATSTPVPSPGSTTPAPGAGPTEGISTRSVAYPGGSPHPEGDGVALGKPSSTRLTTSTPSWFHVAVPVNAPGARPRDLTLVISASSWSAYHVHRETGYAPWECVSTGSSELTCHLQAGATTFDLGFDVQTADPVAVRITLARAGGRPASTELRVG